MAFKQKSAAARMNAEECQALRGYIAMRRVAFDVARFSAGGRIGHRALCLPGEKSVRFFLKTMDTAF
jgi:hypothetical protein